MISFSEKTLLLISVSADVHVDTRRLPAQFDRFKRAGVCFRNVEEGEVNAVC